MTSGKVKCRNPESRVSLRKPTDSTSDATECEGIFHVLRDAIATTCPSDALFNEPTWSLGQLEHLIRNEVTGAAVTNSASHSSVRFERAR